MAGCRTVLLVLLLAALPLAEAPAAGLEPVYLVDNGSDDVVRVTADRAAEIVRRQTGGRVLSVERRGNGRPAYRVKVLLDGQRIRYVVVDARSGRVRD